MAYAYTRINRATIGEILNDLVKFLVDEVGYEKIYFHNETYDTDFANLLVTRATGSVAAGGKIMLHSTDAGEYRAYQFGDESFTLGALPSDWSLYTASTVPNGGTLPYACIPYNSFAVKSRGEDGTSEPVYFALTKISTSNQFSLRPFLGVRSTHANCVGGLFTQTNSTTTTGNLTLPVNTLIEVYASKNFIIINPRVAGSLDSINYYRGIFYPTKGDFYHNVSTTSALTAGSNVSIPVSGGISSFTPGKYYMLISHGTNNVCIWERVKCTAVDRLASTIKVETLRQNYDSGARIGINIQSVIYQTTTSTGQCAVEVDGLADSYSGTSNTVAVGFTAVVSGILGLLRPDTHARYYLSPVLFSYNYAFGVMDPDHVIHCSASRDDFFGVNELYTATVGSSTGNTLVDTNASWTANAFADKFVLVYTGVGAPQCRKIVSNTATALTIEHAWDTNPSSTNAYVICDYFYRSLNGNNDISKCVLVREVW